MDVSGDSFSVLRMVWKTHRDKNIPSNYTYICIYIMNIVHMGFEILDVAIYIYIWYGFEIWDGWPPICHITPCRFFRPWHFWISLDAAKADAFYPTAMTMRVSESWLCYGLAYRRQSQLDQASRLPGWCFQALLFCNVQATNEYSNNHHCFHLKMFQNE